MDKPNEIKTAYEEWEKNPEWTKEEMEFTNDFKTKSDPYAKYSRARGFYAGYKAGIRKGNEYG